MTLVILLYLIVGNIYLLIKYYTILNNKETYWLKLYKDDIPRFIREALLWPISFFIWLNK